MDTPSLYPPFNKWGIPQANSTTSSPRVTSPRASDKTLPCSRVIAFANSSFLAFTISRKENRTWVRFASEVFRHSIDARFAAATASSITSIVAKSTFALTSPVAGLNTSPLL